jgi:hypothetical protein
VLRIGLAGNHPAEPKIQSRCLARDRRSSAPFSRKHNTLTASRRHHFVFVPPRRSRVNFFINKFRKLGFIDYNGKLEVKSSLLSIVLHE